MESIVFESGMVSASLQVVFERFGSFAQMKIDQFFGVDKELKKVGRTLLKIQALVDDVETRQSIPKACQILVEDLRSVLFDADDLLDEIGLKLERLNPAGVTLTDENEVRNMVLSSFEFAIPAKVRNMYNKLNELIKELEVYFKSYKFKFEQPQTFATPPTSSSLVDERSVIGRDEEKRKMIEMLSGQVEEGESNVSVISIVGMGGIGKTTFAQLVYNDPGLVRRFDLRMWVCVSLVYDVVKITKSIYESVTKKTSELSNLDSIQIELQERMRGRKFFLVLDDMWNEDPENWHVLKLPFRFAAPGSMIVVTTRSEIVSSIVATMPTTAYRLDTLSEVDCWTIIKQRAFSGWNHDGHEDLETIGLEIAEKCKGLPLAAKTIGSVLRFKSREMEGQGHWDTLLKSEHWGFSEDKNKIYPVLKQSYDHLPPYLKRCFTYCSIFPRSKLLEFVKDDLVQLWSAEGFIQVQGMGRLEDNGTDYVRDLALRSFFQFSHVNELGERVYKMHELIHNLSKLVSADLCLCKEDSMSCILPLSRNVRRLSLVCEDIQPSTLELFRRCQNLRTFMVFSKFEYRIQVPYELFLKFRCVRVLNLSCNKISELPESIGILIHLRYLNLSNTCIEELPESIGNLYGLETLKLKECKLLRLPESLKKLIRLRHLEFSEKPISSMPPEVGKLSSLQTLSAFIVGKNEGHRIEELKNMNFLRGSLCITNLENVVNSREAETAGLKDKQDLDKLELRWNESIDQQFDVLAGLQPHSKLKELTVTKYGGVMFPDWFGHSCHKLVNVRLQDCRFCELLPPLGRLPALKSLYIEEMRKLKSVNHLFCSSPTTGGFPSLQSLTFHDMPELESWSGINENDMPCLRQLTIVDCPKLDTLPSIHYLTSLENLDISHCDKLRYLPDEGLPRSLGVLIILKSTILKERCKVGEGADWDKIKHIRSIEIDYEVIPFEGRDD